LPAAGCRTVVGPGPSDPLEKSRCIDFILTGGEVKASSAEVLFAGEQQLRGGPGHVSDHVGLSARLHLLDG
jgi:endonuclease/exonuclease/phosphatase family metal-dependent hydrolase